jgi:hypothetical protein
MEKHATHPGPGLDLQTTRETANPGNWLVNLFQPSRALEQVKAQAPVQEALLERGDALFVEAWADPSNLEMDWLYLYTMVIRPEQKLICLEQALYIYPSSEFARRELKKIRKALSATSRLPARPPQPG